jgi:hypothetical protein
VQTGDDKGPARSARIRRRDRHGRGLRGVLAPPGVPLHRTRLDSGSPAAGDGQPARPPRIVVYRRPLMARADNDDQLGEIVFEAVVEEFARLLGIDPEDVDPDYAPDE